MATVEITIRRPALADAPALAVLHGAAWRSAYRGIIPGVTLERMIARRGPDFWRQMQGRGGALILEFDGTAAGYAVTG
ncbi:MAG TPA: GNAT family N-acetyltransferase, partial [Paracoccaceae bacterium]|nr:GNAT family N-acetyltransferase [Paracoccaceae bacterium]